MSRNCSTPGTNSSSISRNRRRRCQPVGGLWRSAPQPPAPPRPSASCDAAPRKGARPGSRPWAERRRGPGTARLCAAARAQATHGRAGPRSWHTRRRGGPTRPNTRTRRASSRVPGTASGIARKSGTTHAITGSLDARGWRLYDGAVTDHRARAHDREENPLFGEPLWLLHATARRTAPRACEGAGVDGGRRVGAVRPQQLDRPGECGLGASDRAGRSAGRARGRWTVRGGQRLSAG